MTDHDRHDPPKPEGYNRQWMVRRGEREFGPLFETDLMRLAKRGRVEADDLIAPVGEDDWKLAGERDDLFPEGLPSAAPAASAEGADSGPPASSPLASAQAQRAVPPITRRPPSRPFPFTAVLAIVAVAAVALLIWLTTR